MDDFILRWPDKVHGALTEALEYLAGQQASPVSDGVLGEFVDRLVAMKFLESDGPPIAQLIEKKDPLLAEAGVQLGASLLRDAGGWEQLEAPLCRMISRAPVDSWVALALGELVRVHAPPAPVYAALAARHGQTPTGHGIMRNRHIQPWKELEEVYAQLLLQVLEPGDAERAVLPILEKKLGTQGFLKTQARVLTDLGFDPAEHRKLLARRP